MVTGDQPSVAAGTPRLLRAINERLALELIQRLGPLSRAEIARRSGLSKPTISLALSRLEQAGLVREVEDLDSARVDGAGEFAVLRRVVVPLAKPAIAAVGLCRESDGVDLAVGLS
jgi:DNA-binding transcriptional ArsR family regulator